MNATKKEAKVISRLFIHVFLVECLTNLSSTKVIFPVGLHGALVPNVSRTYSIGYRFWPLHYFPSSPWFGQHEPSIII